MSLRIVRFDKGIHNRETFDCGDVALNEYLRRHASQHLTRGVCTIFVLTDDTEPSQILGFYTLSNSQIARIDINEQSARRLPHHPIPTITLGRMGVHQIEQGKGHGAILLVDAIKRCCLVSQEVGVYAIVVDAKNAKARRFYEHYGFTSLPHHPLRLILPMGTATQLLAS
jgi:GNAT superfamily N-acetyltransferase